MQMDSIPILRNLFTIKKLAQRIYPFIISFIHLTNGF